RRRLAVERPAAIAARRTATRPGAFYVFPGVSAFFGRRGRDGPVRTGSEVATYLLRHAGVAAVPGEDFGAPAHVRFSYAASREILENGLARVARALAQLE